MVYPALLSQVAKTFRERIPMDTHMKDFVEYKDCFVGRDAVDTISMIIKTTDRNLALLLGRALDAQKFFHDVTYHHRLRDSLNELYQFQNFSAIALPEVAETASPTDDGLPNGRFMFIKYVLQGENWSKWAPKEVVDSVSKEERKRQEAIFEVINNEREYVNDLENIQLMFVEPLHNNEIIGKSRRDAFLKEVFNNAHELLEINSKLRRNLLARQKENHIVHSIGDIFAEIVGQFGPYVRYGAGQPYATHIVNQEISANPEFAKFLQECERRPESRKLPLHHFLTSPTTHMGRYLLLLKSVLEATPEGHPDKDVLPTCISSIREVMANVNKAVGKSDNRLKLAQLEKQLIFSVGEHYDLRLRDERRELIREGVLVIKKGTDVEISVFLFDHALLMTKKKKNGYLKVYKKPIPLELLVLPNDRTAGGAQRRMSMTGIFTHSGKSTTGASSLTATSTPKSAGVITSVHDPNKGYPFTFVHLSHQPTPYSLYAASQAERGFWKDALEKQKRILTERNRKFEIVTLVDTAFQGPNKVHCSAAFEGKLLLGTEQGLYVGPEDSLATRDLPAEAVARKFQRVLDLDRIMQVEVLPEYDLLIVLSDKNMYTFSLDVLDLNDMEAAAAARKGRKIGSHYSFFKQGVCAKRVMVCAVKSAALSTTIKVFEPQGTAAGAKRKGGMGGIGKLFRSTNESLKLFKEFYIPTDSTSVHFLKTKLCVGCTKGFEIVDLDSLDTQGLLDPTDESLEFVLKREHVKPISIFRSDRVNKALQFVILLAEFAFYVDKLGRRAKGDWIVYWTGKPEAFALKYPYIIAFEPKFIEIRHVDTGELQQVIPTSNLRCLNVNPDRLHCVMDSVQDYQHVFRLHALFE
ncbi:RHO1 GDP-GTP exchange protein 2 [Borealophlyctis nickersoniae]|nr:RHO1 GDP-GTP exchange protein 2 [Borealophlyctis nickersoniae]